MMIYKLRFFWGSPICIQGGSHSKQKDVRCFGDGSIGQACMGCGFVSSRQGPLVMRLGLLFAGLCLATNIMRIPREPALRPKREAPAQPEDEPKRLVHYAAMAYCDRQAVKEKSCGPCQKIRGRVEFVEAISSHKEGHSLLLMDHYRREVVVAVRGLGSVWSLKKHLTMDKVPVDTTSYQSNTRVAGVGGAGVMDMFKEIADTISDDLLPKLNRVLVKHADYRLQLVGHSLGGALATLLAITINQELRIPFERMDITSYGQPRVGNLAFATWFNRLPLSKVRVVNGNDFVPHLPVQWREFYHTKNEMFIHEGISRLCPPTQHALEDLSCSRGQDVTTGYSSHFSAWGVRLEKEAC